METMLISTAAAGAARAPGEMPITGDTSAGAPLAGADAFIAALLAQGMIVPEAAAAQVGPGGTGGGKEAPPAEQVLPLVRPLVAAAPAALRRTLVADDKTAAIVEDLVENSAETTAALELDDALVDLKGPLAGKVGDVKSATRAVDLQTTPTIPIAAAVEVPAELATPPSEFATESTTVGVTSAQAGTRTLEQGGPAQVYAARPTQLPLAEPDLFAERLTQQISVMVAQHSQQARIAVSPPELGPVEVRVVVQGDEATIHLAAPHAATREALEEALPRLRAAFADSGLSLGQAGVFAEMPQRQQQDAAATGNSPGVPAFDDESTVEPAVTRTLRIGLVDAFV